jgi:TonB family protein
MIANAMLYTMMVSVPLTTSAWFVARFLRAHGRPERFVWSVALAATMLVPAFMLSRPRVVPAEMWVESTLLEPASAPTPRPPASTGPPSPAVAQSLEVDRVLLAMWLGLSVALAARWGLSALRLGSLRRSWISETIDGVHVALTPELGPAVSGVLRPQIVVPAWVPTLPPHQRALVLAHEQEHIRARDPWLGTCGRICRILSPWNPATWLLGTGLRRAVELDCDRRVLRIHPSVQRYGETLLVVSARGSNRLVAAAAFAETDVPLRKRILAMTTPPSVMSVSRVVGAVAVSVAILSCTATVPVPAIRVATASDTPTLQGDGAGVHVVSAASPDESVPVPRPRIEASGSAEIVAGARAPIPDREQQALAEPRVVASKEMRWMEIYRSIADVTAGRPPLMRVPWSSRDSAFAAVYEQLADSALYALRDSVVDGLLGIEAASSRLPVGTQSVALPSDPPPTVTVPPRILNPDEIVAAIRAAYPRDLLDRGRGGTVGMQFLVGSEGEVQGYKVGQISAYTALDQAARQVASVYRFSPAFIGDEPVTVWVAHAISFYPPE